MRVFARLGLAGLGACFALVAAGQPSPWGGSPFTLEVSAAAAAADHVDARVAFSFPPKHILYDEAFKVTAGPGARAERVGGPEPDLKPDPLDPAKQVRVYAHAFETLWRVSPRAPGVRLTVEFQGCDDKVCFLPETRVFEFDASASTFKEVPASGGEAAPAPPPGGDASWNQGLTAVTAGGYMGADEFLAFLDRVEGKVSAEQEGRGLKRFLRDPVAFVRQRGMLLTLLLVLLGGVLLNLTPCVLPMIPINLAILGAGAGTRGRGFLLGSAYGAGIVLVYGGLGWAILRSGIFFGALQASPWFNLTVGLVFVGLALALFDVFVIDFTRLSSSGGSARKGVVAAFSAGAVSALLAGACVAPVVLAVLLLAGSLYASGATSAQLLPFVLGLGMALPWPFAGAGLSVMPSPGLWMVRVKQAFGVFLALLAAYYLHVAWTGFAPSTRPAREGSIAAGDREAWLAKVAQAKAEGKPLFVDFWATWCKNCGAMERGAFADPRVKARLAGYVVVKVQSEKPERSPAREMLQAFEIRGLPGFVVLK